MSNFNFKSLLTGETYCLNKEVKKIHIYNAIGILLTVEPYNFEVLTSDNAPRLAIGKIDGVYLEKPLKRATKLNFNRDDNFYMNYTGDYSFENGYQVYINESEIKVSYLGELLNSEFHDAGETTQKNYKHYYNLTFKGFYGDRSFLEPVYCDNYELKENERFADSYGTPLAPTVHPFSDYVISKRGQKGVFRKWHRACYFNNITVKVAPGPYSKIEYLGIEKTARELSKEIENETNLHISSYDLRRILTKFDIVKK